MINQQDELLGVQKRLVEAMEKVASPERVRGVEQGQEKMVDAIITLSGKMETANEQLGMAVSKLANTFWGVLKVPVAMVVVGLHRGRSCIWRRYPKNLADYDNCLGVSVAFGWYIRST
jgi:hypothetical protein